MATTRECGGERWLDLPGHESTIQILKNPDSSVPRIGLNRVEAAEAIGISLRTVDLLMADRTSGFPFAKIGSRVVIPMRELVEWLAQQTNARMDSLQSNEP